MTKVDTELFELCKQTYEATGWKVEKDDVKLHWIKGEDEPMENGPITIGKNKLRAEQRKRNTQKEQE